MFVKFSSAMDALPHLRHLAAEWTKQHVASPFRYSNGNECKNQPIRSRTFKLHTPSQPISTLRTRRCLHSNIPPLPDQSQRFVPDADGYSWRHSNFHPSRSIRRLRTSHRWVQLTDSISSQTLFFPTASNLIPHLCVPIQTSHPHLYLIVYCLNNSTN